MIEVNRLIHLLENQRLYSKVTTVQIIVRSGQKTKREDKGGFEGQATDVRDEARTKRA